jgi:hypothetical protein
MEIYMAPFIWEIFLTRDKKGEDTHSSSLG